MVSAGNLTKHDASKATVGGVIFTAGPGQVTGFLGPNGAGKSTPTRMIVGLDRPDGGYATVGGQTSP